MEGDDPLARVRARRIRQLVDELLPKVRRLNPTMPDDQVLEIARHNPVTPQERHADGTTA